MNTFKKGYLLPLLLVCSSQYQVHGTTDHVNWFDRITWGIFDNSQKGRIENEIKKLKKQEQKLEESLKKTKEKIEESLKKAATGTKNKIGPKLNNLWDSLGFGEEQSSIDGTQPYQIAIHLPGFKRQDLKITKDTRKKYLHIVGTKAVETRYERTGTASGSKEVCYSEEFISNQNIDGKNRHFRYKDGKLDVTIDLPDDVANKEFDTSFEKETLTVSFK